MEMARLARRAAAAQKVLLWEYICLVKDKVQHFVPFPSQSIQNATLMTLPCPLDYNRSTQNSKTSYADHKKTDRLLYEMTASTALAWLPGLMLHLGQLNTFFSFLRIDKADYQVIICASLKPVACTPGSGSVSTCTGSICPARHCTCSASYNGYGLPGRLACRSITVTLLLERYHA